jgi:short-subunit dehydrogenase
MTEPRTVLITGASGGIGAALARAYAEPGRTLVLTGRDGERLGRVAADCRDAGATIETHGLDLRDTAALLDWLGELDARLPLDLVLVNAGVTSSIGRDGDGESWDAIEGLLAVNVNAALATAQGVLPGMRARGAGHIVFISSIAAYFGLPITPSYCASKAALKAYAEAWRGWLGPEGIAVSVVCPGFVESEMSRQFPSPRPFLWSPERAAATIRRRLRRRPARISFPFPLSTGMWWLGVLPVDLSLKILQWMGFGAKKR